MGIRSVRFHDLLTVHRLEANRQSHVLWPAPLDDVHSAAHLALASAWQDVNQTVFTFVLRERGALLGLAQVVARPGHDAWDLVRLALVSCDADASEGMADALLAAALQATAGRGGLRTFARTATDGTGHALLARYGFRHYATEYTLIAERLDVAPMPLPDHLEFRTRRPADAWGIFQLYCSVAPPQVRHAEGLNSKRWNHRSRLAQALVGRWQRPREVVLADEGLIVGWVRLMRLKRYAAQRLEVMLHPRASAVLPALLAHALVALEARLDVRTVGYVRAYEETTLAGLRDSGFDIADERALLVKHAAARVTERQLLIAALRAQGLGLDVSHYQQPAQDPARVPMTPLEHILHDHRTRAY